MLVQWAGVAQLAERLLPKQDVVGSSPIARSYPAQCAPGLPVTGLSLGAG